MALVSIIIFLLIESLFSSVACWTYKEEFDFRKKYLRSYNREIRPLKDLSRPVDVNGSIQINDLRDFDLVQQSIKIEAYLTLWWCDEILYWNNTQLNITSLTVLSQNLWVPEIGFYNTKSVVKKTKLPQLLLQNNGRVGVWIPINFEILCKIDAYAYPFDRHQCRLDIFFDDYDENKVKLRTMTCFSEIDFNESNWLITPICSFDNYNGYSRGYFILKIARKIQVKSFSSLMPLIIFLIINIMTGHLPVESGEKVTLATMVFLSNVVYLGDISKQLPKEPSQIPLIFLCHLILTFISGISVVGSIVAGKIYWKIKPPEPTVNDRSNQPVNKRKDTDQVEKFKEDNQEIIHNETRKKHIHHANIELIIFKVITFISVLYAVIFIGLFCEYILRMD